MLRPVAYLNGHWVDAERALVSVHDAGFVLGATVSEQLRTFHGRLFRLEEHLSRLADSLQIVGIDLPVSWDALARIAREIVQRNFPLLPAGGDLGLSIFVTPGAYATFSGGESRGPTYGLHTYPLPFELWSSRYEEGQPLVTSDVRQVPESCWPRRLKCRSRMHYYLAQRQAASRVLGAQALLLDEQGCVTETATANLLAYFDAEGLVSPPREDILPGITLAVVEEFCARLHLPRVDRRILASELEHAHEVILTSTPSCLLPVTSIDGRPVADGRPGPVYQKLLAEFGKLVSLDIAAQAKAQSSSNAETRHGS
jgi:branched-chain amino acid aminotransferase